MTGYSYIEVEMKININDHQAPIYRFQAEGCSRHYRHIENLEIFDVGIHVNAKYTLQNESKLWKHETTFKLIEISKSH